MRHDVGLGSHIPPHYFPTLVVLWQSASEAKGMRACGEARLREMECEPAERLAYVEGNASLRRGSPTWKGMRACREARLRGRECEPAERLAYVEF